MTPPAAWSTRRRRARRTEQAYSGGAWNNDNKLTYKYNVPGSSSWPFPRIAASRALP